MSILEMICLEQHYVANILRFPPPPPPRCLCAYGILTERLKMVSGFPLHRWACRQYGNHIKDTPVKWWKYHLYFSGGSEDKFYRRLRWWEKEAHEKDIHLKMTKKFSVCSLNQTRIIKSVLPYRIVLRYKLCKRLTFLRELETWGVFWCPFQF